MCLRDLELLLVDWILILEVDFVLEILGQTQVVFVDAESILMFAQYIQVSLMIFLGYLQVKLSSDFFPG
jgi:hypothetical protein